MTFVHLIVGLLTVIGILIPTWIIGFIVGTFMFSRNAGWPPLFEALMSFNPRLIFSSIRKILHGDSELMGIIMLPLFIGLATTAVGMIITFGFVVIGKAIIGG